MSEEVKDKGGRRKGMRLCDQARFEVFTESKYTGRDMDHVPTPEEERNLFLVGQACSVWLAKRGLGRSWN